MAIGDPGDPPEESSLRPPRSDSAASFEEHHPPAVTKPLALVLKSAIPDGNSRRTRAFSLIVVVTCVLAVVCAAGVCLRWLRPSDGGSAVCMHAIPGQALAAANPWEGGSVLSFRIVGNASTRALWAHHPEPPGRHGSSSSRPRMLVGILSAWHFFDRRATIRSTWLRELPAGSRHVFIVGHVPPGPDAAQVEAEGAEFGDLLMASVEESYSSLVVKVLTLFHFSSITAPLPFLVKADDDTFLLLGRLGAQLARLPPSCVYMGAQLELNPQLTEDPGSKWYVKPAEFPTDTVPKYMQGGAYVISNDLVSRLAATASDPAWTPPFPSSGFLEDASIGRMLQRDHLPWGCRHSDFRFSGEPPYGNGYCEDASVLSYHHVDPSLMRRMYEAAAGGNGSLCDVARSRARANREAALAAARVARLSLLRAQAAAGDTPRLPESIWGPHELGKHIREIVKGMPTVLASGALLPHGSIEMALVSGGGTESGGDLVDVDSGGGPIAVTAVSTSRTDLKRAEAGLAAALRSRLPAPPGTPFGPAFLTLTSMVRLATPTQERLLREWLDFHLLQGASRFVLYSHSPRGDGAADRLRRAAAPYVASGAVELIDWPGAARSPALEAERAAGGLDAEDEHALSYYIKGCDSPDPTEVVFLNGWRSARRGDGHPYECQMAALIDAAARHRGRTDWLFPLDFDEFAYSITRPHLAAHLRSLPPETTAMYLDCSSFGTAGLAEPPPEPAFMIEALTRRAPYYKFGEDETQAWANHPNCSVKLDGLDWAACQTGPGKTVLRGAAIKPSDMGIHKTPALHGKHRQGGLDALCNHYVAPTEAELAGRRPAHRQAHALAGDYYNSVTDSALASAFGPALKTMRRIQAAIEAGAWDALFLEP